MSGGSISRANNNDTRHHSSSLFSNNIMSTTSATSDGNRMSGTTTGSMQQHLNTPGRNNQERNFRGHIVRLNSIEPNTVMFNTKVRIGIFVVFSKINAPNSHARVTVIAILI